MRTLVTGGAGFIGSHLVRSLVDRGYEVVVIDNLSTGKLSNIPPGAELIQETILNPFALVVAFSKADVVFHLAAVASVPASIDNPIKTLNTNAVGTMNVLEAARQTGVKKVMFASSASVYSNSYSGIQSEDTPTDPLSPYALSKLVGEQYCSMYTRFYLLPTVCLRYFNVYGDNMNPKSEYALAVPAFIDRVLNRQPLIIYGDGEQTRDYVFIDDVVNASIYAAESEMQGVYNVGTGVATSINRLAEIISGGKSQIIHEAGKAGEARHNRADIAKLEAAGFKPSWSLEDGLRKAKESQGLYDTV